MVTRGAAMPKRWRSFHTRGTRLRITPASGHHRHLAEAFSLGQAEHQVHVLHRLARSALDEVVDHRKYHQRIGATPALRSEEHTTELQSRGNLVCLLLL